VKDLQVSPKNTSSLVTRHQSHNHFNGPRDSHNNTPIRNWEFSRQLQRRIVATFEVTFEGRVI